MTYKVVSDCYYIETCRAGNKLRPCSAGLSGAAGNSILPVSAVRFAAVTAVIGAEVELMV
jgi:hypothetical protein